MSLSGSVAHFCYDSVRVSASAASTAGAAQILLFISSNFFKISQKSGFHDSWTKIKKEKVFAVI